MNSLSVRHSGRRLLLAAAVAAVSMPLQAAAGTPRSPGVVTRHVAHTAHALGPASAINAASIMRPARPIRPVRVRLPTSIVRSAPLPLPLHASSHGAAAVGGAGNLHPGAHGGMHDGTAVLDGRTLRLRLPRSGPA